MFTLSATSRTETGKKAAALRAAGSLPAVVYGPKQEALSITLSGREFEKVLRGAGESSVIEISGLAKPLQVLVHEVNRDPVTDIVRHVDFYAIEKGAKVEVAIPLTFVGESGAVKAGASLVKVIHEVEVEADPSNLPHEFEIDLSVLAEVGQHILVSDLKVPAGVSIMSDLEQVIVLVQETVVEEEVPATEGVDMAAIEVEKKGKTEEAEAAE